MSETTTQAPADTTPDPSARSAREEATTSLVDTIFDLGFGWAATGLKVGKTALEQSAKTLVQTAKALENLATELEKDGASAQRAARSTPDGATKS